MNALAERELYESKPALQAVLRLALPSVLVQIVLVIYNMADTFFIGLVNNNAMTAAITVCTPAFMFLSAIANLFGIGAAGAMSRALGSQDFARGKNASRFSFWGCVCLSGIYVLGVFFFVDLFVNLLGGIAPEVHVYARQYLLVTVALCGIPTAFSNYMAHIIRSEGRSAAASIGLAAGGILNILLDPLLMFVLLPRGSEVLGAAIATGLSNCLTVLYYFFVVRSMRHQEKTVISFHFRKEMFSDGLPGEILRTGLPACVMTLFENISYAVLENFIALAGVAAQAGLGVAKKINMLAHSIVRGMSQGVLSLIGYNYANGNRKRMQSVIQITASLSVSISLLCMLTFLLFGHSIVAVFLPAAGPSQDFAVHFLHVLCLGAPFSAFAYTVISFFQATMQGGKSLLLALLRKGILDIPLMFVFQACFRYEGAVWVTPLADFICCTAAALLLQLWLRQHMQETELLCSEELRPALERQLPLEHS